MWLLGVLRFILCMVPAAALAVAAPWWLHEWLTGLGVSEIAASQLCIILGATIVMIGVGVGWHVAGWSLVSRNDNLPRILHERKFPAVVVILSLIVIAWGVAAGVAGVDMVEALSEWGIVGQIVAGALGLFVIAVVALAWRLASRKPISKRDIADSTPTVLKIAAALLLAAAAYVQRLGDWIAEQLQGGRRA